jgi:hypothetical protein
MLRVGALIFGLALAPIAAPASGAICGVPVDLHDGWPVAGPEREGLNPAPICCIGPRLKGWTEADPHDVVVARHGVLVYENNFAGPDTSEDWEGAPMAGLPGSLLLVGRRTR